MDVTNRMIPCTFGQTVVRECVCGCVGVLKLKQKPPHTLLEWLVQCKRLTHNYSAKQPQQEPTP